MTLNITVAARWLMAQSSDFRLTSSGAVVSEASQKQVVLQYSGWSGLVCYTGVAAYGSHNTASWLEQVLTHDFGTRSPDQVVKRLIEEGSLWLRKIPAKDRRHSFTMIAYVKSVPYVYVISNFERPNGPQLPTPADALFCTRIRPRGPRCIVTGWASAVSEEQKERLKDLLSEVSSSPERLREAVAQTSRESSVRAKGTVRESCVVAHLRPDGSGEAQVFGNLHEEFLPTMIAHGMNVASYVPAALTESDAAGPHRLVGVTWTSNGTASAMLGAYRAISNQTGSGWQISSQSPITGD